MGLKSASIQHSKGYINIESVYFGNIEGVRIYAYASPGCGGGQLELSQEAYAELVKFILKVHAESVDLAFLQAVVKAAAKGRK